MAGSIALDSTAQASFTKAVQSLIKNDELQKEALIGNSKKRAQKGVVYIAHIPHGFYEEQMRGYFSQFGKVTNVKLARSKKTGKSKGFAFIEFEYAEVAQVVAETMNNYIMCNRLLKAEYMPHHRIGGKNFWKTNVTARSYPRLRNRRRDILAKNGEKAEEKVGMMLRKRRNHADSIIEKLNARGISYSLREFDAPDSVQSAQPPTPVLEIDESDEEIEFQLRPDFTLKKKVLKKSKKCSSKLLKAGSNKSEVEGSSGGYNNPEPKLHLMNVKKNLFGEGSLSPKAGRNPQKEESVDAILPLSSNSAVDSAREATSRRKSKRSTEVLPSSSARPSKEGNPAKSSKPKIKKLAEKFSARLQKKLKSRRTTQQNDTSIDKSPAKFARKLARKSASSKSAGDSGRKKFSSKKLKINRKLQGLADLGM